MIESIHKLELYCIELYCIVYGTNIFNYNSILNDILE